MARAAELPRKAHQLLSFFARAEDRHARNSTPYHCNLVAAVKTRTALAVLEYLVGQFGFVFHGPEAIFEEEVRNARE